MELNSLVYPAPEPSCNLEFFLQSSNTVLKDQLILVDSFDEPPPL